MLLPLSFVTVKIKLILLVERVLFLKFDSVYSFGSSLRQTADFIYLGREEYPLSLSSAVKSSSSCLAEASYLNTNWKKIKDLS